MAPIIRFLFIVVCIAVNSVCGGDDSEDPELYYYGLEESERSLPVCSERQACTALVRRYWRPPALLRLCRCARRTRCDKPAFNNSRIHINNRDYFQFCQPITGWPQCKLGDTPLLVETTHDRLDPDEIEELHHRKIHLYPPKATFHCLCPEPNYWKLNTTTESDIRQEYQCSSLPPCKSGEFCGNVNHDLNALYQSCLCPKHHICVHDGGIAYHHISELLYRGKGWKAHCQRIGDFDYEDYYNN